jgi:hypothetical protein
MIAQQPRAMGRSENSCLMTLGTAHYYANLPEELKPDFKSHRHPLLGTDSDDCQPGRLSLPQNEQGLDG